MQAIKFSETIYIEGTQELIFDYTQDYNNRFNWDTFLKESRVN